MEGGPLSNWSQQDIALGLIYVFMMLLAPGAFRLGRLSMRYFYHRYLSSEDIYVTYQNKGTVTNRYKIQRRKNGSIVEIDLTTGQRRAGHE